MADAIERALRSATHPLVRLCDRMGLSPTALTFLGLAGTLVAAGLVWTGHLSWGAIAYLLASMVDMLDGALARWRGQESRLGAFLDSTFDRISETAMLVALLHDVLGYAYGPWWLPEAAMVALAGSLAISYTRARAEGLGEECKVGWLERPERIVMLSVALLIGREAVGFVLFALAILTWLTVLQRIVHVWRRLARPV